MFSLSRNPHLQSVFLRCLSSSHFTHHAIVVYFSLRYQCLLSNRRNLTSRKERRNVNSVHEIVKNVIYDDSNDRELTCNFAFWLLWQRHSTNWDDLDQNITHQKGREGTLILMYVFLRGHFSLGRVSLWKTPLAIPVMFQRKQQVPDSHLFGLNDKDSAVMQSNT